MLDACDGVSTDANGEGGAEGADEEWVFAVGFLGAAPERVGREVDADAAVVGAAKGAEFFADGEALEAGLVVEGWGWED